MLENDRRLAIVDGKGAFVNGKRTERIHAIRAEYDLAGESVRLGLEGRPERDRFALADRAGLGRWFSDYFQMPVRVIEDREHGLPDDLEAPGPTVLATSSLETVAGWFPGLSVDDARVRFRATLEIGGVEPFWEDRLYGRAGSVRSFPRRRRGFRRGLPLPALCRAHPITGHRRDHPGLRQSLLRTSSSDPSALGVGRAVRPLLPHGGQHPARPDGSRHDPRGG